MKQDYAEDSNDELLRRMGALASIVSMYVRQDNPERARSAQDDVDRCRREALRRMGSRPLPICEDCADGTHCGAGWSDPDYVVTPDAELCEAADCQRGAPDEELCEHPGCEDAGSEWEIVEGQWCYDHVPRLDNVPQEWLKGDE